MKSDIHKTVQWVSILMKICRLVTTPVIHHAAIVILGVHKQIFPAGNISEAVQNITFALAGNIVCSNVDRYYILALLYASVHL